MYNAFIIDSSVEGHLVCSHSLEKISKTFWLNKAYMTFFCILSNSGYGITFMTIIPSCLVLEIWQSCVYSHQAWKLSKQLTDMCCPCHIRDLSEFKTLQIHRVWALEISMYSLNIKSSWENNFKMLSHNYCKFLVFTADKLLWAIPKEGSHPLPNYQCKDNYGPTSAQCKRFILYSCYTEPNHSESLRDGQRFPPHDDFL